jgi:hypothetical protein
MIWRHSHVVLGLAVKLGVFKLVCRHSLVPSVYFEVIVHTSARAPHPSAKKPESVMSHRSWVHLLPTVSSDLLLISSCRPQLGGPRYSATFFDVQ